MQLSLQGKVAVITGAGSGIGRCTALTLSALGASIAVVDLNGPAAENVAQEIVHAGGKAIGLHVDITHEQQVDQAFEHIVRELGPVDILVSNAGIQIINSIEDFAFTDWKQMLAVHLDGAFLTTKAALRSMYPNHRGGSVIYLGSVHSHEASKLKSAYVTAKHGLLGLSRTLAKEGAEHNVRSHVVCPGYVETPLVQKQIPQQAKELGISEQEVIAKIMLAGTVDGQFTDQQDIADMIAFLACFPSTALTGQSLIVSHGMAMH